jgi:hypothetical protein
LLESGHKIIPSNSIGAVLEVSTAPIHIYSRETFEIEGYFFTEDLKLASLQICFAGYVIVTSFYKCPD